MELGEMTEYFLSQRKPSTEKTYRTAFLKFSEHYQEPVDAFILRVDEDNRKALSERKIPYADPILTSFKDKLLTEGYAAKSVRTYLGAIQGLAKKNHVPLSLEGVGLPADLEEVETVAWTSADNVAKFLGLFKVKVYEVVGILMFQSGLSIGDALGLRYGVISEELEKGVCPLCLDFHRKGRSKTGVKFVTFCGQWTINNLLAFLNGKKPGQEERLFNTCKETVESYFRSRAQEFLGKWEGRNNPASPHSLRHGFRSIVHESKLVRKEDLEFFMGHGKRNKIETDYTDLNVESWRKLYAPALKVLEPSFILEQGNIASNTQMSNGCNDEMPLEQQSQK